MGSKKDNNDWLESKIQARGMNDRMIIEGNMRFIKSYAQDDAITRMFDALIDANYKAEA